MSILRGVIGLTPASILAIFLFHFSIYDLGLPLVAFFANLIMLSWAVGLVSVALLMRYGLGAESLIWFIVFLLAPISAVYYPVSVLPDWLRMIAMAIPARRSSPMRPIWPSCRPDASSTARMAGAGPMPMMRGGTPTAALARMRALGLRALAFA